MNHPLVSIVIALFNAEAFIEDAIQSVFAQSYENWELLIINDGSTDNSENIIKQFIDERIIYIFQENQGVSAARNAGLKKMNGNYFCFLDADDKLTTCSLKSRLKIFQKNLNIQFVDGHVKVYDQNLKKFKSYWSPSFKGNPLNQLLSLSGNCFFGPTWMFRTINNKSYMFHEKLTHGEDLLFFIELSIKGGLYDYCDEVILHYRKGHHSAMKNLKGLENGYRYIYQTIRNDEKISPKYKKKFKKKAVSIIFKSYLGNFQPIMAILFLLKKWRYN